MKDYKRLLRYIGIGIFLVGGICMLLAIIQAIGLIGSFDIFGGDNSISSLINLVTISIFCFVVGWIFVDFFQ